MSQEKKIRQSWVDFARGIAIILVLYRHVFSGLKSTAGVSAGEYMYLEHLNIMFFSFRMPLFFIVSGIFLSASFAKRDLKRYIENKAATILYPLFVWGILQITIQLVFSKYVNENRTFYDYLYLIYSPRRVDQFWYLSALFNVSVLYVIMKYALKIKLWPQLIFGILIYYFSSWCHKRSIDLGFLLDIGSNYIYIVLGDFISGFMRSESNRNKLQSRKVLLGLVVPFFASQILFLLLNLRHPEVDEYRYIEYYLPFLFLPIALTGCAFIISCCFVLQRFERPAWLKELGSYSLYIYVAHVICFASVRTIIVKVLHINNVPFLLISGIFFGLTLPVLIYKLCVRWKMTWVFKLDENKLGESLKFNVSKPEGVNIN